MPIYFWWQLNNSDLCKIKNLTKHRSFRGDRDQFLSVQILEIINMRILVFGKIREFYKRLFLYAIITQKIGFS